MSQVVREYHVGDICRNELRQELQQWISPPDPSVNYDTACDAYHGGTVAWCTKGNTFNRWSESGSLLWIHGRPGSGKSVLSSVIIRGVKTMSDPDAGSACVAYFYFDFKDTGKQDLRALLTSLLVQLSNQSNRCFDVLFGLYQAHHACAKPSDDSLAECLKKMLTTSGQVPIYLILDALDECPNDSDTPSAREKVLTLVKDLVELHLPNLHLCITSCPELDIRTALDTLATQQLSLDDESGHKQDIIDYVTFVVRSDQRMQKWGDEDKDAAIEKLTEKADGIFQWVIYQLEALQHCSTDVRRTLEELPKSLEETYERILKGIDQANRDDAYRLLQCLAVAVRPLQIEELAAALAFDFNEGGLPRLNADWRWEDQGEAALSACSHLVSAISSNGTRIAQFSHSSVKEFLMSDRLASSNENISRFHILIEPSHATLAQACLGALLRLDECTDTKSVKQTPLAQYAGQHWVRHARFGDVESQIVDALDCFLDADNPHFTAWVRIQFLQDLLGGPRYPWKRMESTPHPAAPLYFAVERGFRGPVERLVVKYPQQINASGGECGTPLHASALRGRIEIAQLLVVQGADINSRSRYERTPLHIASEEGHLEFAEWLLDSAANVNLHEFNQNTPLHLAATRGRLDLVEMLLKRGAEVQARGIRGYTPLFSAAEGGNPDVVRLLLDHGADAQIRDDHENSALHIAAVHGHLEVSRMLLALNLDVNARNDGGNTPLYRALQISRKPEVLRLLLDHGADVHGHYIGGSSALHLAAGSGNPEIVQMILDRNTEVDIRDGQGATPLLTASSNGNPDVVQLLIDHGADPYARDKDGKTALDKAGTLGVSRMLIRLNVSQTSAFFGATSHGDPEQMRLLLDYGASADERAGGGYTPLHFAAATGRLGAARFLVLELNADINCRDDEGTTPLHLASQGWVEGTPKVVQFLLENGADVKARNNNGETAYEVAWGEHTEEIQDLLSKHATAAA